MVKIKN